MELSEAIKKAEKRMHCFVNVEDMIIFQTLLEAAKSVPLEYCRPQRGETYFTPTFSCLKTQWDDDNVDMMRWENGLVCRTAEEARLLARKILYNGKGKDENILDR